MNLLKNLKKLMQFCKATCATTVSRSNFYYVVYDLAKRVFLIDLLISFILEVERISHSKSFMTLLIPREIMILKQ